MKPHSTALRLCQCALFAAIIYVFTAWFHVPSHTGYTHIGDAFLYLAACLLPAPYACAAGAVGAGLADVLSGYAIWLPGTVVIKALTALCFTAKQDTILSRRNVLGLLPAFALCAGGYYLYECLLVGNLISPLLGIPGYVTQVGLSAAVYLAAARLLDQVNFKKRFHLGGITV